MRMAVRANYGPAFLGWSPEAAVRDRPALDVSVVPGGKIDSVDIAPPPQVQLVREAVAALAEEPADQMSRWPGALVTDELALDFENAYSVLPLPRSRGRVRRRGTGSHG
jgi:hypothetical protein